MNDLEKINKVLKREITSYFSGFEIVYLFCF